MNRIITIAIITLACSVVNPLALQAATKKETETLQYLIDLMLNEGGDSAAYGGALSQDLDLPDPAPTKNIDAAPKWATEAGRSEEEVTDNRLHSCSVLVEKSPEGVLIPKKLLFQVRLESGRDSETYNFRTSLDGTLEKARVHHGKLDEKGDAIRGSAINAAALLDIDAADVKSRFQHELDLWLTGEYFKKKFRKKHLEDLAYYRNKRNPPPEKKKKAAGKTK